MTYDPFKCPDCKTWWRTATHKCETPVAKKVYMATCGYCKEKIYSKLPHKCKPSQYHSEYNKKDKKGNNPHDPEIDTPRWNS